MSMITIRARDSVTALEQVERRFGADALIHSLVSVGGQVEVTASRGGAAAAAAVPQGGAAARPEAPGAPATEAQASGAAAAPRLDVMIDDDPLAPEQDPSPDPSVDIAPDLSPDPAPEQPDDAAPVPHLPKFLQPGAPRPFAEVLQEVKARAPDAPPQLEGGDAPEDCRDAEALRARLMSAPRVVLCGPAEAGKSQAALQLALMRLAADPETRPEFLFCGTGSVSDGAFLAQKSHLLGMRMTFDIPETLGPPDAGHTQIVVISGRAANAPQLARQAMRLPGSVAALVLPAGLRPERLARTAGRWAGLAQGAILSAPAEAPSLAEERDDLAHAGLTMLWESTSDALVDGLRDTTAASETAPQVPEPELSDKAPLLFFNCRKSSPETRP